MMQDTKGSVRPATRRTVAHIVSIIFNPLVYCTLYLSGLTAVHFRWALECVVLWGGLVAAPAGLLALGLRAGIWSDWDVSQRAERRTYMPWVGAMAAVATILAWQLRFPAALRFSVDTIVIWLVLSAIVGFWWKISLHVGGAVGIAGLSGLILGWRFGLGVAWAPLLVAWARLILRRHTLDQVIAGAGAGLVALAIVWFGWGMPMGLH